MARSREERLLEPTPGSAIARAKEFGIDLTLLNRRLKLTPEERLNELQQAMIDIEELRGAAAKARKAGFRDQSSTGSAATR
jgi:hypothetical protein